MCAEVFLALLHGAEKDKKIRGLFFSKNLSITHLLFADDSLVFIKATRQDCYVLKEIFDCYARAFGQIFNFDKSSLFFSPNTKQQVTSNIKSIFNLKEVSMHEKYLGLPPMVGRNKKCYFNEVKLKVMKNIKRWHSSLFFIGVKEVLIKAVAQAIPTYAMSIFKVPLGLCDDLQKLLTRF